MSESSRLARNTTYLTIASLVQKVLSLWYFAYLSTHLAPENTGKYAYALTFTSVFSLFMDFGIGQLLTREGAKDPEHMQSVVDRVVGLKVVLMLMSGGGLIISILAFSAIFDTVTAEDVILVCVAAIAMTIDTITSLCWSIFRARKDLLWEAISTFLYQLSVVGVGVVLLNMHAALPLIVGSLIVGSGLQCIGMMLLVLKKTGIQFRVRFNRGDMRSVFAVSWPFALANLCNRLYGSVDQQLLKVTVSNTHVALYAIAYKCMFALTVIPGSFATSYYPLMSQYLKEESKAVTQTFVNALTYMFLLSIPIAWGVMVLGDNIIVAVWKSEAVWGAAVDPLRVLMCALPFVFLNYPIGNLLNAASLQKLNTRNMVIALVVNVVFNVILIPRFSYMGAAYSFLISSIVLVMCGLPKAYRIAGATHAMHIVKQAGICMIGAIIMAGVLYTVQHTYSLITLIGIGAAVYGACVFVLRGIELADIRRLVSRKL